MKGHRHLSHFHVTWYLARWNLALALALGIAISSVLAWDFVGGAPQWLVALLAPITIYFVGALIAALFGMADDRRGTRLATRITIIASLLSLAVEACLLYVGLLREMAGFVWNFPS